MKKSDLKQIEIIDAAERRFLDIGYNKTTMAEIAEDLGMSAANLYRFFKSKQDIAAACAERCLASRGECLKGIVAQQPMTAAEKLLAFVLEDIRYTFERENEPKVNELISIVTREHKEIVLSNVESQCALIAEIIEQGNATGEFDVSDVEKTAGAIYSSLTLFEIPIFLPLFSKEQFEKMARDLVELLLLGLNKR